MHTSALVDAARHPLEQRTRVARTHGVQPRVAAQGRADDDRRHFPLSDMLRPCVECANVSIVLEDVLL